ncbi:protein bric-a-brac 1-like isoform X4 [Amphibalanus amphitrite]|uniref:protein bric-a-brac 1-like isoform X4 n=1 Tax=Amphibalanus amphitrite TaxID=1232801 RepID=UPI001C913584|nr:protein bric-a-brac 1-like isoform X4 [Amphibalanus amphitrite]
MALDGQKFCLKWDGFQSSVTSLFDNLRQVEELVDITLCCEGHQVRAHRMMLSVCSPYFRDLLKNNPCQQMVFFLKDTTAADLNAVIEFIYKGSVNVSQSQLASFIKTAEMLQIRGLSGEEDKAAPPPSPRRTPAAPATATPPHKRRRISGSDTIPRRSPASPSQRPRTPTPPPGGQPLPPPPPPQPATLQDLPLEQTQHMDHQPPPPPQHSTHAPTPVAESVKVEKIDLTEDEEEASLDSTLCHVAEYEGGYDGSNSGMEQMPMLSADALGGLPPLGAGPSQPARPHGLPHTPGGAQPEDGSGADSFRCETCGKAYSSRVSLHHHSKMHAGATTCALCGRVSNRVADLRTHLKMVHKLSAQEIRALVPTREYQFIGVQPLAGAPQPRPQ